LPHLAGSTFSLEATPAAETNSGFHKHLAEKLDKNQMTRQDILDQIYLEEGRGTWRLEF